MLQLILPEIFDHLVGFPTIAHKLRKGHPIDYTMDFAEAHLN